MKKDDKLIGRLLDCREMYISEPTRFFSIDERVVYGNHDEAYIKKIFDEGKIYRIHTITEKRNYHKIITEENDHIICWHDLLPYSKDFSSRKKYADRTSIRLNFSQQDIRGLFTTWYHFGIDTETDYQRPLVWDLKDKNSLIDSIFKNIEIGKFALIQRPFKEGQKGYEMLDGKQRLDALIAYFEDRFEWNGLRYSQLHPTDQGHFDNYPISITKITHPMSNHMKYEYFLRLNTFGKPQNQKHLDQVYNLYLKSKDK